eukprot:m.162483 g.162483  ORF g.162483 m.162483 type:complete len:473 (-) comp12198_c0_seq1:192-1610(-)
MANLNVVDIKIIIIVFLLRCRLSGGFNRLFLFLGSLLLRRLKRHHFFLFFFIGFFFISLNQPVNEWFGRSLDLRREFRRPHILLRCLLGPLDKLLLVHDIKIVKRLEDAWCLRDQFRPRLQQLLGSAEAVLFRLWVLIGKPLKQTLVLLQIGVHVTFLDQRTDQHHDTLVLAVQALRLGHDSLGRKLRFTHLGNDKVLKDLETLRHGLLEVVGHGETRHATTELGRTLARRFFRRVNRPLEVLLIIDKFRLGGNVAAARLGHRCLLVVLVATVAVSVFGRGFTTLGATTLLFRAALLARRGARPIGRVVDDKGGQLVRERQKAAVTTRLAGRFNLLLLRHTEHRFWVVASGTEHKFLDKPIQNVLKAIGFKRTVDNVPFVGRIHLGLGSEFNTQVLGWIRRWTVECLGNVDHVGNGSLDAIASAFNFANDHWHFVSIKRILNLPVHIHHFRHDGTTCHRGVAATKGVVYVEV